MNSGTNKSYRVNLFLFLSLVMLAGSCKKSGSGNNTPSNSSYVSSESIYSPQTRLVDSFTYDNTHRLTVFTQIKYDTTSGSPQSDTMITSFSYFGENQFPDIYRITQTPNAQYGDVHQLYYDGQNRMVKDSGISGTGYVNYFSYPGSNIVSRVLFDGTASNDQVDTIFFTNGNVTSQHIYYPNNAGTADSLSGSPRYGYSTSVNPLYHAGIAGTAGILLNLLAYDGFGGYVDFLSADAINMASNLGGGLPAGTVLNFTVVPDSKGRVAWLTISGAFTISFNYY
jgi:hypothetical protein